MTSKPTDDREKAPVPRSPDDPLPEVSAGDPAENIEDEGEVPGVGNFA